MDELRLKQPGVKGLVTAHSDQWNAVIQALERLYEAYSAGRVAPRDLGYDDEVDVLMQEYDRWLG